MKVQLLKNLIKESVREVLKEELKEILLEIKKNSDPSPPPTNTGNFSISEHRTISPTSTFVSLEDILNDTKQSMSRSDYSNILNESTLEPFIPTSTASSIRNGEPVVGLDITNLDFVKKAASVYNLSKEKDRK